MGQDLTYWVENTTWPDHPHDERVAFMLTENQVKHFVTWKKKDNAKGAGLLNRHGQKTSKQERKNAFLMQEMFKNQLHLAYNVFGGNSGTTRLYTIEV